MVRRIVRVLLTAAMSAAGLAACGEDDGTPGGPGSVGVVASTTQVADLARNVGGRRAEVRGLLGANADPHDHELRPSDLDALADADVVLRSGGDIDAWLDEGIDSGGRAAEVVTLIDAVEPLAGGPDGADPHWWQDPRNAIAAVRRIRDVLVAADPAGKAAYEANAAAYTADLRALDAAVAACIERVPADRRKLVTTHDALGYYARRYGIEVVGAVIPSRSSRGQPSAGETAALISTIEREGVETIFAESSVNPKVEQAIARESGARVGAALYADTLGPEGSGAETYLGSIAANTAALVDGFTRGRGTCALPADPAN